MFLFYHYRSTGKGKRIQNVAILLFISAYAILSWPCNFHNGYLQDTLRQCWIFIVDSALIGECTKPCHHQHANTIHRLAIRRYLLLLKGIVQRLSVQLESFLQSFNFEYLELPGINLKLCIIRLSTIAEFNPHHKRDFIALKFIVILLVRQNKWTEESVRHGKCSTISSVVRLGFVRQHPCRTTSCVSKSLNKDRIKVK